LCSSWAWTAIRYVLSCNLLWCSVSEISIMVLDWVAGIAVYLRFITLNRSVQFSALQYACHLSLLVSLHVHMNALSIRSYYLHHSPHSLLIFSSPLSLSPHPFSLPSPYPSFFNSRQHGHSQTSPQEHQITLNSSSMPVSTHCLNYCQPYVRSVQYLLILIFSKPF
jgi:hypothetical protein